MNDRLVRDAAFSGNVARYINHACSPNCYTDIVGWHIWVLAGGASRRGRADLRLQHTDGVAGKIRVCAGARLQARAL